MTRPLPDCIRPAGLALMLITFSGFSITADAAPKPLPEIRLTAANQVPRCVTPDRLMTFLQTRNTKLDPRFKDIARWYKSHGEGWSVRWDYAFYQMALETNFLTYRRPDGRMGDVNPAQNNFAGIGTTGGGVPGDRFPDVRTGVLAQIQHLVAYSGEKLAQPVAPRTRLKQDDIVKASRALARPVRYSDLARRWAVDPKYASSIAYVANEFMTNHCPKGEDKPLVAAAKKPAQRIPQPQAVRPGEPRTPAPQAAARGTIPGGVQTAALATAAAPAQAMPAKCTIRSASYGGQKTVLIRHDHAAGTDLTALTVLDGFEKSMVANFMKTRAPGATTLGEFADPGAALDTARKLCPAT